MTHDPPPRSGATTGTTGTAYPVDFTRDRRARRTWLLFLGGPVVWISHFMLIYLAAEAGCTGEGPGLEWFQPPVAAIVTVVATIVGVLACLALLYGNLRRLRIAVAEDGDIDETRAVMGLAGALLSGLSALAVVADGIPGLVFPGC